MSLAYAQADVSVVRWGVEVHTQGAEGSCTSNAKYNNLSLTSYLMGQPFSMNVQTDYNMALIQSGHAGQDVGVNPTQAMENWQHIGVTQSAAIAYGPQSLNVTPSTADYADAAQHTITGYHNLNLNYSAQIIAWEISDALLHCKVPMLSFAVEGWFMNESGPISTQPGKYIPGTNSNQELGLHMVAVEAIDTTTKTIEVASWGKNPEGQFYGDHGYFAIDLQALYNQPYQAGAGPGAIVALSVIDGWNGVDLTMNAVTHNVALAFNAMLDRAPELSAMKNCVSFMNSGHTLTDLCNLFTGSSEFQSKLPAHATSVQTVDYLFSTIQGHAPDAAGEQFWANAITSGVSVGSVAATIIRDTADVSHWADGEYHIYTGGNAAAMNQALRLYNRATISEDYAIAMQAGDAYGSVAHSVLSGVTSDTNTVMASLVGVPEALGYGHVAGVVLS